MENMDTTHLVVALCPTVEKQEKNNRQELLTQGFQRPREKAQKKNRRDV